MRTSSKSIITASLVLPLLLVACDRPQQPPTGSAPSQEKMAANPSSPPAEQMPEKSPPSPADVSKNPAAPSSPAPSTMPPVDQKNEPK